MKFEKLEKVLAHAIADTSFREQLMKGKVNAKEEFGLSNEEIKVLQTLLAGKDAPGFRALLNVVAATPVTATNTPATGVDIQRLSQVVEKKLARLENTDADVHRISQIVEKKLARQESSGADIQRISQVVEKKLARLESSGADIQRISQVVEKKLARLESLEANLKK